MIHRISRNQTKPKQNKHKTEETITTHIMSDMPKKTQITLMKKADLMEYLTTYRLSTTGKRPELQKRLVDYCWGSKTEPPNNVNNENKQKDVTHNNNKDIPQTTTKPPTKSQISASKKEDLKNMCGSLHLDTSGGKKELIARIEQYYRPSKEDKAVIDSNVANNDAPSSYAISNMNEEELKMKLNELGLSTEGAVIQLAHRLEQHYRPNKEESSNDNSDNDDEFNDKPKYTNATITLSVQNYMGRKIGIDIDSKEVYEKNETLGKWELTDIVWDLETNRPKNL